MSGAVCPECMGSYFKPITSTNSQCEICGWQGDINRLPRTWLTEETQKYCAINLAKRKAGKLFYVRVLAKGTSQELSELGSKIMEEFQVNGMSEKGPIENHTYTLILETRPAEKTIRAVQKIKNVKKITIF